jgi:tetratricopeptide (TPR) repeat protein
VPSEAISRIVQRFSPVVSKRLGVVLGVYGESGIGKSWTVRQVLSSLVCRSLSIHATASDAVLAASLPRPKKLPGWADKQWHKLEGGESVSTETLLNTLVTTLAGLAPFVLHLEDANEASVDRQEFILKLAQSISRQKGVGLIVTSRNAMPFGGVQLEALTKNESDGLLAAELGADLPQIGLDYVFARARGNPLFTLEFLKYLTRQGFLWSDGKLWYWREPPSDFMPVSLEALIEQMLVQWQLEPEIREVLEARAVLGNEANAVGGVWLKVGATSKKAFAVAKRTLENDGILSRENFAHPLIPEVMLRSMTSARRQVLSRRCWNALKDAHPVLACNFIEHAGLGNIEVLALLERALESTIGAKQKASLVALRVQWTPGSERFEVALTAARTLIELDFKTALGLAEHAQTLRHDHPEVLYLLTEFRMLEHRLPEAEKLLDSLPESERGSRRSWQLRIKLLKEMACFGRAIALWQSHPEFHVHAAPTTIHCLGWCIMELGVIQDLQYAENLISRVLDHDLSLRDRYLLLDVRGNLAQRQDRYDEAAADYDLALEYATRAGSHFWRAKLCNDLAHVMYLQDRNDEAIAYIEQAYNIMLEHGNRYDLAQMQSRLGVVFLESAKFERAESLMQKSRETLQPFTSSEFCEVNLQLANLYLSWNTAHSAVLARWYAQSGVKVARALGAPHALGLALFRAVQCEVRYGDLAVAGRLLEEFSELVRRTPVLGLEARLAWASAWLSEANHFQELALEHYGRAAFLFEQLEDQSLVHQVQLEIDRLNNDKTRALRHLEWFQNHGLERLVQQVLRAFPAAEPEAVQPTEAGSAKGQLRLRVLGTVSLERDGTTINYRGRKRLEFLAYLLETRISGRNESSTLELVDAIYPELLEPEAKSALKQLVYLLRSKLGPEVIESTPQGYALGAIGSDAEEFLNTAEPALWHGVYLEGLSDGWLPGVRDALVQALQQKIESLAKTDAKQTARLGQILLEMEPYDRDTLELILRSLGGADPLTSSLYQGARMRFAQIGENLPNSSQAYLASREVSMPAD